MKEKNPMSSLFFGCGQAQPAGVLPARPPIMVGLAERIVVSRVVCPLCYYFYFSFLSRANRPVCQFACAKMFVLRVCLCRTCCTIVFGFCFACVGFAGSLLVGYAGTGRAAKH